MAFEKRWYQTRCENNIQKFLDDSAHQKGLIVHSVATGKSIIPSMVSGLSHKPTLVVQPTAELLDQNLEKARTFGFDPSVYSASRGSKDISDLTYATPMSIIKNPEHFKRFKIVVQDESHLMTTNVGLGKDAKKGKFNQFLDEIAPEKILGMTATPIQLVSTGMGSELKMMNRSMRSFWYKADVVDLLQIQEIEQDYWADVQIEQFDTESNFLKLNSTGAEFRDDSIIKQYEENNLDREVLEKYNYLRSKGKNHILTFVPSVEIALRLAKTNPDFEVVYGDMDKKERQAIISDFKAGNIPHILSVNTMSTGFDYPELDGIIMARETSSFSLYYQKFGRIVRPIIKNGEIIKKQGLICDLTSNTKRFGNLKDITFEKNDYTNGWGMWSKDRLMTGSIIGDWDMPSRKSLEKKYKAKGNRVISKNTKTGELILGFGKYKGWDLEKAFTKDAGYFQWMHSNFNWNPNQTELKQKIEFLLEQKLMHGS